MMNLTSKCGLGVLLALALGGSYANGNSCSFTRIPVKPVETINYGVYVGKGKSIEVSLHNEDTGKDVDSFPEPPLMVRNLVTNKTCEINEGGIWARDYVFLSNREDTLLVTESSGSSGDLVFYNTANCTKRHKIDISEAYLSIESDRIVLGYDCWEGDLTKCKTTKAYVFDGQCNPKKRKIKR